MTDPKPPSDRDGQQDKRWYERTRYQVLLFAGGIALFGLVLGVILDWYIDPQTSTQKKDLVQALGLITAGVAGAVGIFFTWRGQRLSREAQEQNQKTTQAQLENAQEELRLTRQGQITERFTRAIDQLGGENLDIRLGGIYALDRISRESKQDHWPIMEILTAYVRLHAPKRPDQGREGTEAAVVEKKSEEVLMREPWHAQDRPLAPDIQAIMSVIRRRTRSVSHGEPEVLNLRQTCLSGAILEGANLQGAILVEADLSRAYLMGTKLFGARLQEATLSEAFFDSANLNSAGLFKADLSGADLREANLSGANLLVADLLDANLSEANLSGANLAGADLSGADLSEAHNLTQKQLEAATGDKNTQLPPHLKPPAHWGAKLDEQLEEG